VEPTGVQRIADRWRGEPVEVIHQIQQDGGLSIGPTAGIVEEPTIRACSSRLPTPNGAAWSIASSLGPPSSRSSRR
jgi:hypothetical protein